MTQPVRFQPYPGRLGWFMPEREIDTRLEGVPDEMEMVP